MTKQQQNIIGLMAGFGLITFSAGKIIQRERPNAINRNADYITLLAGSALFLYSFRKIK